MKRSIFYSYICYLVMFLSISEVAVSSFDFDEILSTCKRRSIPISIVTVSIISTLAYHYYSALPRSEDLQIIQEKYPYAQAWYNDLIKKYPQIHFDRKRFLCGDYANGESIRWKSSFYQIYCPSDILENINMLYAKKIKGGVLTNNDLLYLHVQEFMILCQAGAIQQYHIMQRYLRTLGIFVSLECIRIIYQECTDDDFRKYYESQKSLPAHQRLFPYGRDRFDHYDQYGRRRTAPTWNDVVEDKINSWQIDILMAEMITNCLLCLRWNESFQKSQEYAFACKHADVAVLEQMLLFFEAFISRYEENIYTSRWSTTVSKWNYHYFFHPSELKPSVVASVIEDEIARRKKIN